MMAGVLRTAQGVESRLAVPPRHNGLSKDGLVQGAMKWT